MCHFVTATLPSREPSSAARRIIEKHGFRYAPIENPAIRPQIGESAGYFQATRGVCDCGTSLGSRDEEPEDDGLGRELAKLRRKGWGKAKIARWLDSKSSRFEI